MKHFCVAMILKKGSRRELWAERETDSAATLALLRPAALRRSPPLPGALSGTAIMKERVATSPASEEPAERNTTKEYAPFMEVESLIAERPTARQAALFSIVTFLSEARCRLKWSEAGWIAVYNFFLNRAVARFRFTEWCCDSLGSSERINLISNRVGYNNNKKCMFTLLPPPVPPEKSENLPLRGLLLASITIADDIT